LIENSRWREIRREENSAFFFPEVDPVGMLKDEKLSGCLDDGRKSWEKNRLVFGLSAYKLRAAMVERRRGGDNISVGMRQNIGGHCLKSRVETQTGADLRIIGATRRREIADGWHGFVEDAELNRSHSAAVSGLEEKPQKVDSEGK
jgi:hypothetical protein